MKKRILVSALMVIALTFFIVGIAKFTSSANSTTSTSTNSVKIHSEKKGVTDTQNNNSNSEEGQSDNKTGFGIFDKLFNNNIDSDSIKNLITDTALDWAKTTQPSLTLTADNISKIYCDKSNDIEYCVSYYKDSTPYGYAVISFVNNEAVIKESRIEKNMATLRSSILASIPNFSKNQNIIASNSLIELNSLEYAVAVWDKDKNQKYLHDNYSENYSTDVISDYDDAKALANELNLDNNDSINIYDDNINVYFTNYENNNYHVDNHTILEKYKKHNKLFTEKYIEQTTNKYCCVISALTQISFFEEFCDDSSKSINTTYNQLWNAANIKTIKENKKKNIIYGGGQFDDAVDAFIKFAKYKGKSNTTAIKQNMPDTDWITDKLAKNHPVYFRYSIIVQENKAGHAISILGSVQTKKTNTNNQYDYLIVYDSWHKTPAFINYSIVDFDSCHGASFDVK